MQNKQAKYSNNSVIFVQPLSGNVLISFFCTVTFKNVQIFSQNSIVISETHVYVKE